MAHPRMYRDDDPALISNPDDDERPVLLDLKRMLKALDEHA
jgi:hypothetical protein